MLDKIYYRKRFNKHFNEMFKQNNIFVYKTTLEFLRKFVDSLVEWKEYGIEHSNIIEFMELWWLDGDYDDITSRKIENAYCDTILKNCSHNLNLNEFKSYFNKNGLYFIYDDFGDVIYIGKSKNLGKRALESFLCKFPYGATYIKILKLSDNIPEEMLDNVEKIAITDLKPIYNNTNENIENINEALIDVTKLVLNDAFFKMKEIYPTRKRKIENDIFSMNFD